MSRPKDEQASNEQRTRVEQNLRVRPAAVAGMFYPNRATGCRKLAAMYIAQAMTGEPAMTGTHPLIGGIVPHAGWICSGAIAGETIGAIRQSRDRAGIKAPDVVIVLGAVHTPLPCDRAMMDDFDRWQLPGLESEINKELRTRLGSEGSEELFATDDRFHRREHAVEVEVPLIQSAWPDVRILPVEVPLVESAIKIGRAIAREVQREKLDVVILASSDLTHYGPAYEFAPAGVGEIGLQWARENDRRLLGRVQRFEIENVVGEVRENLNACGGGAIAAMLSACRELGATRATLLRQTNSHETLQAAGVRERTSDNAVGYASVVVG